MTAVAAAISGIGTPGEWLVAYLILAVVAAVIITLHIFLATRRVYGKWLGLIMPAVTLLFGLYIGVGLGGFMIPALVLLVIYCVCQMRRK